MTSLPPAVVVKKRSGILHALNALAADDDGVGKLDQLDQLKLWQLQSGVERQQDRSAPMLNH